MTQGTNIAVGGATQTSVETTGHPITTTTPDFSDIILEVRRGKMKHMPGLKIQSGIDKTVIDGPIHVDTMGIEGDEHDYTFHGGIDKAIHGYCSSHYPLWQSEHPSAAARFVPGGFGENLVLGNMSETNVCIGDIYSVGPPATPPHDDDNTLSLPLLLLQVSLPRQPCFKLNHRFQLKNFAPTTYRLSRTGWYYRVLRPGVLERGYEVRLVERSHPRWTVERVQEYLHRDVSDASANEELSRMEELGAESRGVFVTRVAKMKRRRAAGERKDNEVEEQKEKKKKKKEWREFRIVQKKRETARVMSFIMEAVQPLREDDGEEVELDEGAHVKIKLPNGLVRAYSVVGSGDSRNRFQLGVAFDDGSEGDDAKSSSGGSSRGGSKYLHLEAKVGDIIQVGAMTNGVPVVKAAGTHVFVAGGIGITAFLALAEAYKSINYGFVLHYGVRSGDDIPFRERALKLNEDRDGAARNLFIYDKSKGERMDIRNIVDTLPWNSQLYFCGPKRMMDEALEIVKESKTGIGEKEVHFEAFEADISGDPFEAVIANRKGKDGKGNVTIKVGKQETLLEKLQERFGEAEVGSSCCVGNCGTCKVALKSGRVDHRGTALTTEETATEMLACVSRGVGRIVIEI